MLILHYLCLQVAAFLDLDPSECERPEFAMILAGAAPFPGAQPYAQVSQYEMGTGARICASG